MAIFSKEKPNYKQREGLQSRWVEVITLKIKLINTDTWQIIFYFNRKINILLKVHVRLHFQKLCLFITSHVGAMTK